MEEKKKDMLIRLAKYYAGKIKEEDLADCYSEWDLVLDLGNEEVQKIAIGKLLGLVESTNDPIDNLCQLYSYMHYCSDANSFSKESRGLIRAKAEAIAHKRFAKDNHQWFSIKNWMWHEFEDVPQLIEEKQWCLVLRFYAQGNEQVDRNIEQAIFDWITTSEQGFELLDTMTQHLVEPPYNGTKLQEIVYKRTIALTDDFGMLTEILVSYIGGDKKVIRFGTLVLIKAFEKARKRSDYIWILGHCGRINDHWRCIPEDLGDVKEKTKQKVFASSKNFNDWFQIFHSDGHILDDIFTWVFQNCLAKARNQEQLQQLYDFIHNLSYTLSPKKKDKVKQQIITKMTQLEK
jgi:hypothetical protein